jgi:hypothetical protein
MRVGDVFPSEFLKSEDLGGVHANKRVTVIIADVKRWEDPQGGPKVNLGFHKTKKRLLCNKTNARTIQKIYGEEMDDWVGKPITLYVTMVQFMDEMVEAIRVMAPPPPATAAPTLSRPSAKPLEPSKVQVEHGAINPAPAVDNMDAFGLPDNELNDELNDEIPF